MVEQRGLVDLGYNTTIMQRSHSCYKWISMDGSQEMVDDPSLLPKASESQF